jgi:hypothetical protein
MLKKVKKKKAEFFLKNRAKSKKFRVFQFKSRRLIDEKLDIFLILMFSWLQTTKKKKFICNE